MWGFFCNDGLKDKISFDKRIFIHVFMHCNRAFTSNKCLICGDNYQYSNARFFLLTYPYPWKKYKNSKCAYAIYQEVNWKIHVNHMTEEKKTHCGNNY